MCVCRTLTVREVNCEISRKNKASFFGASQPLDGYQYQLQRATKPLLFKDVGNHFPRYLTDPLEHSRDRHFDFFRKFSALSLNLKQTATVSMTTRCREFLSSLVVYIYRTVTLRLIEFAPEIPWLSVEGVM